MPETAAARSEQGRAAVLTSWANTTDRTARTAAGTRASMTKALADKIDPDRKLDPLELATRVDYLRRANAATRRMKELRAQQIAADAAELEQ